MSAVKDSFLDLERHRLELEENIKQLRKALQHWQTWDAEYEALKEEIEAVDPDSSSEAEELIRVHDGFEGELLHGKEIDEIFGLRDLRPRDQVVNLLQRRIDYVTKNIESLQKQLENAEARHSAATVASPPGATDEDGQPITEIIEELDADDNVLSYHLNRPGDAIPYVKDALEKAGIKDLPDEELQSKQQAVDAQSPSKPSRIQPNLVARTEKASPQVSAAPKETVPFTDDAILEDTPTPAALADLARRSKRVEEIMKTAKEQEAISKETPVIPEDEDPEDAQLRQQMLQYSMGEVGAVVAELQLEEDVTDDEDDGFDYVDDDFDDEDEYDDGDEDRFGRSTGRVVTDVYRQRMLELEKSLGIQSRFTRAAEDDGRDSSSDNDEGIGRIVVKRGSETPPSASKPPPPKSSLKDKQGNGEGKKGVRFAQELDIAPVEEPAIPVAEKREEPLIEPLSDIVERSGPSTLTERKPPQTQSRFKRAASASVSNGGIPKGPFDIPSRFVEREQRETPTGPDGATLADQLIERDPAPNAAPPDDFDDSIDQSAVASEYHRMRKKFIQRQGGFLKEDESPVQELDEAEGGPERMSRFKAARLSRQ